jgi:uncharacterized Zn finger protein
MAEVQGSQHEPYHVRLSVEAGALGEAECSCPYDWDGICKHVVATLLAGIYDSDRIDPENCNLDEEMSATRSFLHV